VRAFRRWRGRRKDARRCAALARAGVTVEVAAPFACYGARSGVWPLITQGLPPRPRIYCFGVGDNAAWEEAVLERHGAEVFAFDPTPVSAAWVAQRPWPRGWHFAAVGLAAADGELGFRAPRKGANYVPVTEGAPADLRAPVRRLATLVAERGHDRLDVLKLDIEGGEYDVLARDLPLPVPVDQLLVEFHHGMDGHSLGDTLAALAALRREGFKLFWISPRGLEFGLVHDRISSGWGRGAPEPRPPAP